MGKYYLSILGIIDKLNDWNEELNEFTKNNFDNVGAGTLIFLGIIVVAFWAIREFNKHN